MSKSEAKIQHEIRLHLGSQKDLVLFRNNVGKLMGDAGYPVEFGLCVGSSDLIGIFAPAGRFVALEIKTSKGRRSPEQIMFIDLINSMGGFSRVLRSLDDAVDALKDLRK